MVLVRVMRLTILERGEVARVAGPEAFGEAEEEGVDERSVGVRSQEGDELVEVEWGRDAEEMRKGGEGIVGDRVIANR